MSIRIDFALGYRYLLWRWEDLGGKADYLPGPVEFETFFDPEQVGITYWSEFKIPYIGLVYASQHRSLDWQIHYIYSAFNWAEDFDQHLLRELEFIDRVRDGSYYQFALSFSKKYGKMSRVYFSYSYEKYAQTVGDTTMINHQTSRRQVFKNGAGIAHESSSLSLGILSIP